MSDVRDDTFADLEADLARALQHAADAHEPTTPSPMAIRAAARRRDNRRRVELGMAVLAAAAILVVLLVGPWRGDEDAYVDSGPGEVKPALHLTLDPASGYELAQAHTFRLDADGNPPGTVPGPEGRATHESILYGGPDPLTPPWYLVTVSRTANPSGPWGDLMASNEQATTVGGRPARLRSQNMPTGGDQRWTMVSLKWDDHHTVGARFWGMDVDAASDALASLHQDEAGRWAVGAPPLGLHELARDVEDTGAGWYQDQLMFQDTSESTFMSPTLAVVRTSGERSEAELVARALAMSWEPTTTIERTTVRGRPAIVVAPGADTNASIGTVPRYRILWFEPEHDAIVDLIVYDADRAETDRAAASVREIDDSEWTRTLDRCTNVTVGGTVASIPAWARGGPCPGAELSRGG